MRFLNVLPLRSFLGAALLLSACCLTACDKDDDKDPGKNPNPGPNPNPNPDPKPAYQWPAVTGCLPQTLTDSTGATFSTELDDKRRIKSIRYKAADGTLQELRTFTYTDSVAIERRYNQEGGPALEVNRYTVGANGFAKRKVEVQKQGTAKPDSVNYSYNAEGYLTELAVWSRDVATNSYQKTEHLRLTVENGDTKSVFDVLANFNTYNYTHLEPVQNKPALERVFTKPDYFIDMGLKNTPFFQPIHVNFLTGKPNTHALQEATTNSGEVLSFNGYATDAQGNLTGFNSYWTNSQQTFNHVYTLQSQCP